MYEMTSEIIVCNFSKTKDIKYIDKAIEKLKVQETRLVDLYLSSTLNVETINHKNNLIKQEIEKLNKKKELINKLIASLEITRDEKYNIEIKNIKFTEEFISKNSKDYIKYLYDILQSNNIGFIYKEPITKQDLEEFKTDYYIFYSSKLENKEYSEQELENYIELLQENFYKNGVINCPVVEDKFVIDHVTLIHKNENKLLQNARIKFMLKNSYIEDF